MFLLYKEEAHSNNEQEMKENLKKIKSLRDGGRKDADNTELSL